MKLPLLYGVFGSWTPLARAATIILAHPVPCDRSYILVDEIVRIGYIWPRASTECAEKRRCEHSQLQLEQRKILERLTDGAA